MSDLFKDLEGVINEASKQIESGVNKLSVKLDVEAKKMDVKSQIGHHERAIRQHYGKLGEAYYNSVVNGAKLNDIDVIISAIKANKKVIELLNYQLYEIERKK